MDSALIAWRAIHFVATIEVAGLLIFRDLVAGQVQPTATAGRRLSLLFWLSFAAMLISGVGWTLLVARAIDGTSWDQSLVDGTAMSVLADTQFGHAWIVRLVTAAVLSVIVTSTASSLKKAVRLALAAVLVGGLSFAGHGASSPGSAGDVHLVADTLHLIAVATWVGGLLPYAIILGTLIHESAPSGVEAARSVTRKYSNLATVAVLTIFATGIVNTVSLVGTLGALVTSDYGRLLSLKMLVFAAMLVFASVNRFVLMPRFSQKDLEGLNRNALIEFGLGVVALGIVAAFGTMPPPIFDSGPTLWQ